MPNKEKFEFGMYLFRSSGVSNTSSAVTGNRARGLQADASTSLQVIGSRVDGNGSGINLIISSDLTILDSSVSDNLGPGVLVSSSAPSTVTAVNMIGDNNGTTGVRAVTGASITVLQSWFCNNGGGGDVVLEAVSEAVTCTVGSVTGESSEPVCDCTCPVEMWCMKNPKQRNMNLP